MSIPIFDTTFVTVTRVITGRRVSQGGRDHTSHRLVALGVSERRALVVLYGISALGGTLALLTYWYGVGQSVVLHALLVVGLALLGVHLARVEVTRDEASRSEGAVVRLVQAFPFKRHVATILVDLVLIVVAYYAAYLLRFENDFEAVPLGVHRHHGPDRCVPARGDGPARGLQWALAVRERRRHAAARPRHHGGHRRRSRLSRLHDALRRTFPAPSSCSTGSCWSF